MIFSSKASSKASSFPPLNSKGRAPRRNVCHELHKMKRVHPKGTTYLDVTPHEGTCAVQPGGARRVWGDPWRSREKEAPVHDIGERWMFRNPAVEIISSICFPPSLLYGRPDHAHPARKIWRCKLEDIKHDGLLISSVYVEVKFGEIHQTIGS